MENILIDVSGLNFSDRIAKIKVNNKEYVYLQDVLELVDQLVYESKLLRDEIEDLRQDIRDNYKPVDIYDQLGISKYDF